MPKILIIDDERSIRSTLTEILEYEKYTVEEAKDGEEGLKMILENDYDVVLCDIKMPKMDGMEVLEKVYTSGKDIPFIMISAHGSIETAIDATRKGAYDFITKPPDLNRLLVSVRNAMDRSNLVTETKTLKKKVNKSYQIIGKSKEIEHIFKTIEKVAPTDARVMITGPNGAGKELVARAIHTQSKRANELLIEVNCAAIPSELIESELFGHEKGSFTSAIKQRIGKFEQASGGTLFLDEIGDMSLSAQAKVLRALQENTITRVGGEKEIKVDVRILAATNKNLQKEIAEGRFREDLFHRINVIPIEVPALKDRADDIPLLIEHFLAIVADDYGTTPKKIDAKAVAELKSLPWTGNIRELKNVVERLVIMSDKTITLEDVKTYVK
ncbi:sigma-54-dependent transcriptional regulator [Cytophaga hutchinsonii]|uniref:Response regulatory protein, sigma 54 related protein n=1 Tax=Cytophaga hutchinsonii (strain ATCC 33406 / DSM 1761 / CIP 103989 / NBRC 15051 / NCIMB 9469 / D465) TaxID=269798 RepID=A0A6N4SSF1_CYTH3|nr:sigma-54 dependent transcriptional regulator [Cytophaga hutchinsonii]ABG59231.1 response regulatory protein, sigma 54 related protein [Cytophaga hutchinsonii ATCC 33406]SFX33793.1 DNA-binding transcriptional response regulator, NtrC family, contains REC, AAA-type ATPase, and a Fis-type DNA-binding domains [Cytophaga hutchinsonii ATCC 33406]